MVKASSNALIRDKIRGYVALIEKKNSPQLFREKWIFAHSAVIKPRSSQHVLRGESEEVHACFAYQLKVIRIMRFSLRRGVLPAYAICQTEVESIVG